jgi:Pyruvate/2-oxoacid:ferredoxin oxidoreductase delta subunit
MAKRKIISINEEKCNGCALCIPNCPEGAIQIMDHKARLVSDVFCDGLGACLGHCPQGAITIEEREAADYDQKKVKEHQVGKDTTGGCPGSRSMELRRPQIDTGAQASIHSDSELSQWPVQLRFVPTHAPYFDQAHILIAADCVPFAYADFHQDLLKNKILLVGCPKLDDLALYAGKLKSIFTDNFTYVHMEVPCCFGLLAVIKEAISVSAKNIPFSDITISIKGEKLK